MLTRLLLSVTGHHYTPTQQLAQLEHLSFDNLLSCDKEMARLLASCPALEAHLALVTQQDSVSYGHGSANGAGLKVCSIGNGGCL